MIVVHLTSHYYYFHKTILLSVRGILLAAVAEVIYKILSVSVTNPEMRTMKMETLIFLENLHYSFF